VTERGTDTEVQILGVINELLLLSGESQLSIKEITAQFTERYSDDYRRDIPRSGSQCRRRAAMPWARQTADTARLW
jgi:hypothetical protein